MRNKDFTVGKAISGLIPIAEKASAEGELFIKSLNLLNQYPDPEHAAVVVEAFNVIVNSDRSLISEADRDDFISLGKVLCYAIQSPGFKSIDQKINALIVLIEAGFGTDDTEGLIHYYDYVCQHPNFGQVCDLLEKPRNEENNPTVLRKLLGLKTIVVVTKENDDD